MLGSRFVLERVVSPFVVTTMASKEESTLLKNIDDNFLSCCVCSERYKNAKILPCVHTFCEQCLKKIVEKRGELMCPICRRSHELPAGGVAALSANLFVNQLVEEFDKQDEKKATLKKCEACDIWGIHQRCIDCSINFCEHCVKAHRYMPIARSHRLIAIAEYQRAKFNNPASVRPPAYCSKHNDNQVKFYCDTCEVTICLECTAIDHPRPEHKFRYLDDAVVEYKQLLTKMTQELQIKENEAGESKAAVQEMTESVDSRFQEEIMKVKVHMENTIEETTHKIRKNGDSLLQQLKTEHEERKTNLQAQLKDLECTENDIAATRDYADKLMQYGNAAQLMCAKNSMTSQIRELLKVTTKCEPVGDNYVEFQSTDNFCETKTLGTIKITEEKRYELCGVSEYSRVDEQITLTLQVTGSRTNGTEVTRERITALMKTPDDKSEHVTVTDNYDRTFSLTYCAKAEGKHELSVSVDGQAVQGSPVTVVVVPKKGTVRTFGETGSEIGQLNNPWGVTMTKSGHVIVDDQNNGRLQSFTSQGKHQAIYKFTEIENFMPCYSAVSEDGKIFTTDYKNKQVVVCDENGKLIKCFGEDQLTGVFDIAISPYNGNVYVVDYSACCIRIYSQSGDYIKCFGSHGNGAGQFRNPFGITVESSEGKVFVSDRNGHSVKVFDADGGFLFSFGSYGSADGQLSSPEGMCNDQQGNVYVCDYHNNRVQKFSSSGTFVCQVDCGAEALHGPSGVCVTGNEPFQTIIVVGQMAHGIRVVAL